MFNLNKESGDYLKQIRNNIPEKINVVKQALDSQSLPKTKEGKIKIIELGTGGGESLRQLKDHVVNYNNVELLAVDIIPKLVTSLKKEMEIEAITANAGALPFSNESISAINASAVLHEVSSYGINNISKKEEGEEISYGKDAVIKTLEEFNRVLLPNGKLAYRDVLAPLENLNKIKAVEYFNKSWKLFAEWFVKDFLDSNLYSLKNTNATINSTKDKFIITASVGFQREFQRHYLMLRDYLRNIKQQGVGINIMHSDWLNESEGLKSVTFSLENYIASVVDLSDFENHSSSEGKIYRGNSDQFDKIYDSVMEYYFTQLKNDSREGNKFRILVETWKEREGSEHYIYGNIADMLKFSCEATKNINSKSILFPESIQDIIIAPRFYYNRYLRQVIDNPEKDGKQIIAFKKLTKEQALKSLLELKSSLGKEILDNETIIHLQRKIEQIS